MDSVGDLLSPNYLSTIQFSIEDLTTKLSSVAEFSGEAKDYFGEIVRTESGTVKTVNICGKQVEGSVIRAALDLRSANFDVTFSTDKFVFTVKGYGHGIGMSQNGAKVMGETGYSCEDIVRFYYDAVDVVKVN